MNLHSKLALMRVSSLQLLTFSCFVFALGIVFGSQTAVAVTNGPAISIQVSSLGR